MPAFRAPLILRYRTALSVLCNNQFNLLQHFDRLCPHKACAVYSGWRMGTRKWADKKMSRDGGKQGVCSRVCRAFLGQLGPGDTRIRLSVSPCLREDLRSSACRSQRSANQGANQVSAPALAGSRVSVLAPPGWRMGTRKWADKKMSRDGGKQGVCSRACDGGKQGAGSRVSVLAPVMAGSRVSVLAPLFSRLSRVSRAAGPGRHEDQALCVSVPP